MISLDEARRRLFSSLPAGRGTERVPLAAAVDRVLARPLVSRGPLPPFDASAMDGYAVRTADLPGGATPELEVRGESAAGAGVSALERATAMRIFTGAAVPDGADAVVPQEDVDRHGGVVRLRRVPSPGQHIRKAGEDIGEGHVALPSGTRIGPGALALAAMLDAAELEVARRPRVTILCTGNELRSVGDRGGATTIPESNGIALSALVRQAGALVALGPIVRDEPEAAASAIGDALDENDLVVTVGGVSVGDHDVVRPALERAGVSLEFWRVAIKPGKPIAVGRRGRSLVLGLPGNPASALVTFALFGMPLLRAMQGDARPHALMLPARMARARKGSPDRIEFVRAILRREVGALVAEAHENQASGAATSLATSDGLAVIPAGGTPAGAPVDFIRWADL